MPEAEAKTVLAGDGASAIALLWPEFRTLGCCGARPHGRRQLCYRALASEHWRPAPLYGTESLLPEQVVRPTVAI